MVTFTRDASFIRCRGRQHISDIVAYRVVSGLVTSVRLFFAKMQARTAEHLGDLRLAQGWAQCLKTLHRVPDEVKECTVSSCEPLPLWSCSYSRSRLAYVASEDLADAVLPVWHRLDDIARCDVIEMTYLMAAAPVSATR